MPGALARGALLTVGSVFTAVMVPLAGCGWRDPLMAQQRSATTVFPTTSTVPGPDLARLWADHSIPCDHPIGLTAPPTDPHDLLAAGMWPTATEVGTRLASVTATGEYDFIIGRLRVLGAVVLQTQSEIAAEVVTANRQFSSAAADPVADNAIRDQVTGAIKLHHDSYLAAVNHVVGELEFGSILPSAQIGHKFHLESVCPDG